MTRLGVTPEMAADRKRLAKLAKSFRCTDAGNAEAFALLHGEKFRYDRTVVSGACGMADIGCLRNSSDSSHSEINSSPPTGLETPRPNSRRKSARQLLFSAAVRCVLRSALISC